MLNDERKESVAAFISVEKFKYKRFKATNANFIIKDGIEIPSFFKNFEQLSHVFEYKEVKSTCNTEIRVISKDLIKLFFEIPQSGNDVICLFKQDSVNDVIIYRKKWSVHLPKHEQTTDT